MVSEIASQGGEDRELGTGSASSTRSSCSVCNAQVCIADQGE